MTITEAIQRGDGFRTAKCYDLAIQAYLEAAGSMEKPSGDLCLKLARCYERLGDYLATAAWLRRLVDGSESFVAWQGAAALLDQAIARLMPAPKRFAKVALLGSYTTTQLATMLRLAAFREGIALDIHQADYGQYQQEIINPSSGLYAFDPDFILLAVHTGELNLPAFSVNPEEPVEAEASRWQSLWQIAANRCKARVIMHNFAAPLDNPFGHLAARLPGSRPAMIQQLNIQLGQRAGANVSIVDCDHLASVFGKRRWFDDRYWHISKQAVALDALPLLARHTIAVLAADLGLSKKCLVLDLDNTLWGGVIGEDGLAGIRIGQGSPEGEAYLAFQRFVLDLKNKGVILAVCSKNNDADAREPFLKHPDMLLKLDDLAMFVANWERKPDNIRRIAQSLNIGLDSMVFVDDNPAEREVIRQFLPEVDVIDLPADPSGYRRALIEYVMFESSSFTTEDAARTDQYRAKAQIAELEAASGSIEDFYRSLQMKAVVAPFDELHLPRIVQLIGKTNQFNLTTRRHTMPAVRQFMTEPDCLHLYLKLHDRFADHGLVSILIARKVGEVMDIDTWLMSCRVIGRTVEAELLAHLCRFAIDHGCIAIQGTYIPTSKNAMVKDVFGQYGFERCEQREDGTNIWRYDLRKSGPIVNEFIELVSESASASPEQGEKSHEQGSPSLVGA